MDGNILTFSNLDARMHFELLKREVLDNLHIQLPTSYLVVRKPSPVEQVDPSKTISELGLDGLVLEAQILGMHIFHSIKCFDIN